MALVWIPAQLRDLTQGRETVPVAAATLGQLVEELERSFPGIRARLCVGETLRPGFAVVVDGEVARRGWLHPLGPESEVHFLPAIGGG
jgi:molybdopterin synthase sulfur carrier subunit